MAAFSDMGKRVFFAEVVNEGVPDWRAAFITGFSGDPANSIAMLCVLAWNGQTYNQSDAAYSATPSLGCWCWPEDVTF